MTFHSTILPSQHSTISPSQGDIASVTSERRISSINGFNELMIQLTINNSYGNDAESNPSSNQKVATYITNGSFPQKLFNNRFVSKIIPGTIRPIDQLVTKDFPGIQETLGARQTVLPKEIFTDVARGAARIFRTLREVSQTSRDSPMPRGVNTAVATARLSPLFQIFNSTSDSPTRTGTQDIFNPIGPSGPQWISDAQKLKTSINRFFVKNGCPSAVWSRSPELTKIGLKGSI